MFDDQTVERMKAIVRMEKGTLNPGSLRVLRHMHEIFGDEILNLFEQFEITGAEPWVLYKYACNGNYDYVWQALDSGVAIQLLKQRHESRFYS